MQVVDAISTLGNSMGGLVGLPADEVAKRIFDYLLFQYLNGAPQANDVLELLGLLEREDHNQDSLDPDDPPFSIINYRFDQIGAWFSDGGTQIRTLYGWGDNAFDGTKIFAPIERILARAGLPVLYRRHCGAAAPRSRDRRSRRQNGCLAARSAADDQEHGIASGVINIPLSTDARVESQVAFEFPPNLGVAFRPSGEVTVIPPAPGAAFKGDVIARLIAEATAPPAPFILFGTAGASRLELQSFTLTVGAGFGWDGTRANGTFLLEGELRDLKVIIDTTSGDGFLAKIMPGTRIEAGFTMKMGVSTEHGFYFSGSGALEVQLPVHIELGPHRARAPDDRRQARRRGNPHEHRRRHARQPRSAGRGRREHRRHGHVLVPARQTRAISGRSTSRSASSRRTASACRSTSASSRAAAICSSISTARNTPACSSFRSLEIVTVKAIGLITTKMPDGSKGFSLLLIITAEFGTGIQLGFGFTLVGLGGLLGLNRTMNLPPLVEGVRTGAVNSIMFPENPVENAPRIISDLRTIFPPYEGRFLIGPMAKLGWGTPPLVTVSIGIIIEIPGNIAIVGVLKVALPTDDAALIVIQVNFVGAIEFDKQRLYFFAGLFESRIVFLTLEGELGLLVAWGDDANFVLSAGGFHPRFNPPPLPFPRPKRIAISLLNTDIARIRTETYFAVTSNTVQFGCDAPRSCSTSRSRASTGTWRSTRCSSSRRSASSSSVSAGVSLKVFGMGLFSIHLEFELSGPSPYRAHGSGSISFFFFDVSADFDITWGETEDTTLPPIPVMPLLFNEFGKAENWRAELPPQNNLLVSLRKLPESESAQVLHPLGSLRVSQRAVPLELKIDKVGNQKPSDANQFELKPTAGLVRKRYAHRSNSRRRSSST